MNETLKKLMRHVSACSGCKKSWAEGRCVAMECDEGADLALDLDAEGQAQYEGGAK